METANVHYIITTMDCSILTDHFPLSFTEEFKTSAIEQLNLLGYKEGDSIFCRAIAPDDKYPAENIHGTYPYIPTKLTELNRTHNIYFVVNGGGDKDRDVLKPSFRR
jgi:hypothetical protein